MTAKFLGTVQMCLQNILAQGSAMPMQLYICRSEQLPRVSAQQTLVFPHQVNSSKAGLDV